MNSSEASLTRILIFCTVVCINGFCEDNIEKLVLSVGSFSTRKSCKWVQNTATNAKCSHSVIRNHCRKTCGLCDVKDDNALNGNDSSTCLDQTTLFQISDVGYVTCTSGWDAAIDVKCSNLVFESNCPRLCGHCCDDFSSIDRFEITSVPLTKPWKLCAWVLNKNTASRCNNIEEVIYHCPGTCNACSPPTDAPTNSPTHAPTEAAPPTRYPTRPPSPAPSPFPTARPSKTPSESPSDRPSVSPTDYPSLQPSESPSRRPSSVPSIFPSNKPSSQPSLLPSLTPSVFPSSTPSSSPSIEPSNKPSVQPSDYPTLQPSEVPSLIPTTTPSSVPTLEPSAVPSITPSLTPSTFPTLVPSRRPSSEPSLIPSALPSLEPSASPSYLPSAAPSLYPTLVPSRQPSSEPSLVPSTSPSDTPSLIPSIQPSRIPSAVPSSLPTKMPSSLPSLLPSNMPSSLPSMTPSSAPSVCIDEVGWVSLDPSGLWSGRTCTEIAELPDFWCFFFSQYSNNGKSPYEACCACGGGDHQTIQPSNAPSLSSPPSTSHSPSWKSDSPSISPSSCTDEPDYVWESNFGYGCSHLTASFCDDFQSVYVNGKNTYTACCVCGGGTHVSA